MTPEEEFKNTEIFTNLSVPGYSLTGSFEIWGIDLFDYGLETTMVEIAIAKEK